MLKKLLILVSLLGLTACQHIPLIKQNSSQEKPENHPSTPSTPNNHTFDNVFAEEVSGDDPYPPTMLPDSIPIPALREAMDEYFRQVVPKEEQDNNLEPIPTDQLENLQQHFANNEIFKPLSITVDQFTMEINQETQYVARIVIPKTVTEAQKIHPNNDILVLNESLAQLGNRLILVAYFDDQKEYLLPYHLNSSTYSLFSISNH